MELRRGTEGVVGEVRHRIFLGPGADEVDSGQSGRATVVAHQELLRHFTVVIKMNNCTHRGEVDLEQTIRINTTNVTDSSKRIPCVGLFPMLEREVHHGDIGVDIVKGVEAVVRLLMPLQRDDVALEVDGGHGDDALPFFGAVKDHDPNTPRRSGGVELRGAADLL